MKMAKIQKIKVLVFCLILLSTFVFGCIEEENTNEKEEYHKYRLKVEIENLKEKGNSTLVIPFPKKDNKLNNRIFEDVKVKSGDCDISSNISKYGKGLSLKFKDDFSMVSEGEIDKNIWDYQLSLKNESTYWIYSSSDCHFNFEYAKESDEGTYTKHIDECEKNLTEGWQLVEINKQVINE